MCARVSRSCLFFFLLIVANIIIIIIETQKQFRRMKKKKVLEDSLDLGGELGTSAFPDSPTR